MLENIKQIADALNGAEYPFEPSGEIIAFCNEKGIVILFGGSDDLMEMRGDVNDERGCYGGGECFFDKSGLMPNIEEIVDGGEVDKLRDYFSRELGAKKITAVWDDVDGYSWVYNTEIPHETFNVMDDGEKYCRGIVFSLSEIS